MGVLGDNGNGSEQEQTLPAPILRIETDPDVLRSFLSDAAHVPGGTAAGVVFPRTVGDVSALVASVSAVLPVGAQSSLTGGATPRGEVVLSTRALTGISVEGRSLVRVGAGVPLNALQRALAQDGLWYPPAPTYDGAFVGGTVATNAAGAATFKYGTTRTWVQGLTLVLADGRVLTLRRGDVAASPAGFVVEPSTGPVLRVPLPVYTMPHVPKLSAGYYAKPGMDLVDLIIGSEGTLAVIVDVTLRVVPRPRQIVALVACANDTQAIAVTRALRVAAEMAWRGQGALDVAAIEYMDAPSLGRVPDEVFGRAGTERPHGGEALLLMQIEVEADGDDALESLETLLAGHGVGADPVVALSGDEAGAARLFELREAVPAATNAAVAAAKTLDPEIQKTAADVIVPFERLPEALALYRRVFESRSLDHAIWGHISDGNLHPNVIPRTGADVDRGRDALVEIARGVMAMGGSPLAEHGVGRSPLKQQLLRDLYGEVGIDQMRAVKRALDPTWKLAPGVLFPAPPGLSRERRLA